MKTAALSVFLCPHIQKRSHRAACLPCPALPAAQGRKLHVTVCEGRPLCEGVQLAGVLAGAGIQCTLITDAQVPLFSCISLSSWPLRFWWPVVHAWHFQVQRYCGAVVPHRICAAHMHHLHM